MAAGAGDVYGCTEHSDGVVAGARGDVDGAGFGLDGVAAVACGDVDAGAFVGAGGGIRITQADIHHVGTIAHHNGGGFVKS